ncbi:non-ribosomal peptide synthetase [Streptomyces sp. NPDC050759]|uniref:non-ribosomal peptide synthetase n=1 Tax=Streptomyces sp. NPDC050759 TaxID=3365635 RepID=UPI0037BAAE12
MTSSSITAQYLARFAAVTADGAAGEPRPLPLTGAQRRFVVMRSANRGGPPDVVPLYFRFPAGAVDEDRLRDAVGQVAAVHPALRLRAGIRRGIPVHLPGAPSPVVRRLVPRPDESAVGALRRAIEGEREATPLRLYLAADTAGGEAVDALALVVDHAACDEQALAQITDDLAAAYAARSTAADVPPARLRAADDAYRAAVELQLDAELRASDPGALAYWTRRLAGVHRPQAAHAPGPTGRVAAADARLPGPPDAGAGSAFPALLDACAEAARELYGEARRPLLGYPWGGRPYGAGDVLGCFLNTVAHLAPKKAAADVWWDDLDRADTPFDEVVRAVRAAGQDWYGELDGMVTLEDLGRRPPLRLGDAEGHEFHVPARPSQAPFAVSFSQGDGLLVRMVWRTDLFPEPRAMAAFGRLTGRLGTPMRAP